MQISVIYILEYTVSEIKSNQTPFTWEFVNIPPLPSPSLSREHQISSTIPMYKNFYTICQVTLSVSHDGYLHFGDTVCIFNPSTETTLSANMAESKMHDEKRLVGPCDVSASKIVDPCIRNTFVIE